MLTCCPLLITEAQFRTDSKSHSVIVCTFHFQETMTIAHISDWYVCGIPLCLVDSNVFDGFIYLGTILTGPSTLG